MLFCQRPNILPFLKILIHSKGSDEDEKKDYPADEDMRPMFCHARAERIGQNENSSQPADTGKKGYGNR